MMSGHICLETNLMGNVLCADNMTCGVCGSERRKKGFIGLTVSALFSRLFLLNDHTHTDDFIKYIKIPHIQMCIIILKQLSLI